MRDGRLCRAGPQRDRPYCFSHDLERARRRGRGPARRSEMAGWASNPAVTFDRALWQAEQARQDAEPFDADRCRDQIPPWVLGVQL